jgi:hypothetical protein
MNLIKAKAETKWRDGSFVFETEGSCCLCGSQAGFRAIRQTELDFCWYPNWFREGLRCLTCNSIPRERALFKIVERFFPNWRLLRLHESSPSETFVSSRKFRLECPGYLPTQYDPSISFGSQGKNYQSEDLEHQTIQDNAFDLVITQDVFEHLFQPDLAIREIARTLVPGGAHVLTVPIVRGSEASRRRAKVIDGQVV